MIYTVTSTYLKNILGIYHVYTWYIHCIYIDIYIFMEYSMYIPYIYHIYTCIFMVYHVLMLHLAADVVEEDRVPFHWLHQQ
jgi:hypothetical protein